MTDYGIRDQLNLFEMLAPKKDDTLEVIAKWFCDEFNLLNTQWKNTFRVDSVELKKWTHVPRKNKTLEIVITTYKKITHEDGYQYAFIQFGDKEKHEQFKQELRGDMFIQKCYEDKDFNIIVSPWSIYIFWENYELKEVKMDKNLQALQHLCQQCKNHEVCQGTGCEPRNKLQKLIEKEQKDETK